MSHIPNSAMPHAGARTEAARSESSESRFGHLTEMVREHPKTTAAAGAAIAAAGIAAATVLRSRSRGNGKRDPGRKAG